MRGSLADFSTGDILQLFQISGKTGILTVSTAGSSNHQIYVDRGRVSGTGADDWSLVQEIRRIEWLPQNVRPQLQLMESDSSYVGMSLIARAILGTAAWDKFVDLQLERLIYPTLSWQEGEFLAEVDVIPRVAPLRINQSPQQLVLNAARWEEDGRAFHRAGFTTGSCWVATTDANGGSDQSLTDDQHLILRHLLAERRLDDLAAATGRSYLDTCDSLRALVASGKIQRTDAGTNQQEFPRPASD